MRRGVQAVAAVVAGVVVGTVSWLAVAPVDECLLLMSLPPQGACQSRLGMITPLGPGESATSFALLTGAAVAGFTWLLTRHATWRRSAIVAAVVAFGVGLVAMPAACELVIPAGRMLHPDELVRRCTALTGTATRAIRPQDAAVWSIAAGLATLTAARLYYLRRRWQQPLTAT